jgi:DNA primase
MFDLVKQQVNLIEILERDLSVTFKQSGEKNWIIDGDKETEACPFCSHHGCFRVHYEEGNNSSAFYKCFSCGEFGDVITWKAKESKLDMGKAVRALAEEFKIKLPNDYSPVQQVFNLASNYYHTCLIETCNKPYPVLNGLTPIRYQTEIRKHKEESLTKFKIGYSDGGLMDYLDGIGVDKEIVEKSGLMGKNGKDFLPPNCFIYPHFVRGRVSHFTFKDPTKRIQYQLPRKYSLNGYVFYGQDTALNANSIALVEGENDWISVAEAGGTATLATIGQISGEQLDWLRENCKEKILITLFDPDDAGDKYRERLELLRRSFKGLVHIKPPEGRDIDDHLANGGNLAEIVKNNQIQVVPRQPEKKADKPSPMPWDDVLPISPNSPVAPLNKIGATDIPSSEENRVKQGLEGLQTGSTDIGNGMTVVGPATSSEKYVPPEIQTDFSVTDPNSTISEIVQIDSSSVIIMKNCYYKIVYKDGIPDYVRISDFTLELKTIILDEETNDRKRELVARRQDGYRSELFEVDSSTKVNTARFKELMAKVADAEWMGKDADLDSMWRLIYSQYPEVMIRVVRQIGRHEKHKCWIFKNLLITDSGTEIKPDENGVFWLSGKSSGLKIRDISSDEGVGGLPGIITEKTREETEEMLGFIIHALTLNFKTPGAALMVAGWAHANVYSNAIFQADGGFGPLMLWGTNGKGKSTIARWLQNFFGLTDKMASTSVQQIKSSTVGFMRKAAYYSSMPLLLDEVRNDEGTIQNLGMIRAWYDRESRTKASKADDTVVSIPIRSTLLMAGEDLPQDIATRERCIMLRVPPSDVGTDDLRENYEKMNDTCHLFSNITYHWIRDSIEDDKKTILNGIRDLDKVLVKAGCSTRISKVWSSAGYFALLLAQKYCPDFDFIGYIVDISKQENQQQKSDNTLNRFFESIEILHARENSRITNSHIMRSGDLVHIWFPATFKEVNDEVKDAKERCWSKLAILRSIKEEPYFVSDDKKICMGLNGSRKVVLTLDLRKCPDSIRNVVDYNVPEKEGGGDD